MPRDNLTGVSPTPESFVDNNVLALFIGGLVAVGLAYGIAWRQRKVELRPHDPAAKWGIRIVVGLMTAGVTWYFA